MAGRLKVVEKEKEKEGAPGGAGGAGGVRKRRVDIDCNGQGVLFVEAMADGCISEYGEQLFTPSMEMRRLIPHIHYDADHSYPLLIIQVHTYNLSLCLLSVCLSFFLSFCLSV
mgnify:FL=1